MDGKRHFLGHDLELVQFLGEVEELHVKVKVEVESVNALLDVEDVLRLFVRGVDFSNVVLPLVEVVLFARLERFLEAIADLLELPALVQILPVVTEDILHSLHVDAETPFDLLGPDNLVRDVWETSDPVEHGRLVELLVLVVQQLVPEHLNVFFDFDQELDLILLDGSSDSGSGEECIENLEDTEHLVGVLGG